MFRSSFNVSCIKVLALVLLLGAATAIALLPSWAAESDATNVVQALQARMDKGDAKLVFAPDGTGYLKSVLDALGVPVDSQVLVFSQTSLQFDRISPKTPRALYFNDNVSVGGVIHGHLIELLATDRKEGIAFYSLDTAQTQKPHFTRESARCLFCHAQVNRWSPGMMIANTTTKADGTPEFPDLSHLFDLTDSRTPFARRWGGWYVSGRSGAMNHRGNVTESDLNGPQGATAGLNVTDLSNKFDVHDYLAPGSDIVALMTLDHQTGFVNLVAQINAQYRAAAPQADIDASIEDLVSYMTFADAPALPSPVTGTSGFSETFPKQGPADAQGRSLRDFDLRTRLFRYPLSFMVYSQSFDSLNPLAKDRVWRRLYDVLRGKDESPAFAALKAQDGAAAIAILRATKPGLPEYWK